MELIRIAVLLAAVALAAQKSLAQSNDVYNFYFQKGSAPGSVVQGGQQQSSPQPAPQATPAPLTPDPAAAATGDQVVNNVVVAPKPETPGPLRYNPHEITLGVKQMNDMITENGGEKTAYTIGYQYNFNRYIGAFAQGHFIVKGNGDDEKMNYRMDTDDGDYLYGGMIGLAVTPIHLDLFGHKFLRVSALLGGRTERVWEDAFGYTIKNEIQPLFGAAAEIFLNENVGLRASVAMGTEEYVNRHEIAQSSASLVMSF